MPQHKAVPPPPMDQSGFHPAVAKSDPPAVKLERNRLDALTDWVVAGILGALLWCDKLHGDWERGAAIGGLLAIAGVSTALKSMGKGGSATGAVMSLAAKPVVKAAAALGMSVRHLGGLALVLWLGGCGADVAPYVAQARIPVDAMGRALQRHQEALASLCQARVIPPDACAELAASYNDVAQAQRAAAVAVETIDAVTQ